MNQLQALQVTDTQKALLCDETPCVSHHPKELPENHILEGFRDIVYRGRRISAEEFASRTPHANAICQLLLKGAEHYLVFTTAFLPPNCSESTIRKGDAAGIPAKMGRNPANSGEIVCRKMAI